MSTLRTNTLSNAAGTASVPVDTVVNGTAKAWVNFNGTGTVAIRQGFNVSSITDNGVGDYTVNFTTALTDANYSPIACTGLTTIAGAAGSGRSTAVGAATTTNFRMSCFTSTNGSVGDFDYITAAVFR